MSFQEPHVLKQTMRGVGRNKTCLRLDKNDIGGDKVKAEKMAKFFPNFSGYKQMDMTLSLPWKLPKKQHYHLSKAIKQPCRSRSTFMAVKGEKRERMLGSLHFDSFSATCSSGKKLIKILIVHNHATCVIKQI